MAKKLFVMHPALEAGFVGPDDEIVGTEDLLREILALDMAAPFGPQVEEYLGRNAQVLCGKLAGIVLVGQASAASLMLPALEMMGGLPTIGLMGFGENAGILGWLDLAEYRHNVVRPRRREIPVAQSLYQYFVLDGSGRGLTPVQLTELAGKLDVGESAIRVLDVNMGQVDFSAPQAGMVEKLLGLGGDLARGTRLLHLPAGSGLVAAVMATTIYGLAESWPKCIRLAKDGDEFHVAEVLDCQDFRQVGTRLAAEARTSAPAVTFSGDVPDECRQAITEIAATHGVAVRG